VPASFNRAPLLGETYKLDEDFRVRLRMARSSDLVPIRALLARTPGARELELASLVQFDPRRRCVICATALIDSAETLVGVGAIDIDGHAAAEPDTLLVSDEHAEEIAELLAVTLSARAAEAAHARAA
jgi:hypothetical protein